jgi:hypothetical protein
MARLISAATAIWVTAAAEGDAKPPAGVRAGAHSGLSAVPGAGAVAVRQDAALAVAGFRAVVMLLLGEQAVAAPRLSAVARAF